MSSTYTASAATITPGGAVTMTTPSDLDTLDAASENVGDNKLADYIKALVNRTVFKDIAAGSGGDTVTGLLRISATGEIEFLNGAFLVLDSGSVLTAVAGSALNVASNINMASGSNLNLASGATLAAVAGSASSFASSTSGTAPVTVSNSAGVGGRAFHVSEGHIKMTTAANPAFNTAFVNQLMGANMVKAWGRIEWSSGAPALVTSVGGVATCFNVASISTIGSTIDIAFASTITSPIMVGMGYNGDIICGVASTNLNRFNVFDSAGLNVNFATSDGLINFIVMGLQ